MRRLLTIGLLFVLVLTGFYVAWPAWTGRQIRYAIETNDPALLAQKIDFDQVRARAKPLIAGQMQRSLDQLQKQAGPFGAAIAAQLKAGIGEKITGAAIDAALTPSNVITLAREGKDIGRILRDIGNARGSGSGGTTPNGNGSTPSGSPTPNPVSNPAPRAGSPEIGADGQPRKLTRENIKSYRITGPGSIAVGIARDPKAAAPDVIAELAFTGTDWKVVGILPQF